MVIFEAFVCREGLDAAPEGDTSDDERPQRNTGVLTFHQ